MMQAYEKEIQVVMAESLGRVNEFLTDSLLKQKKYICIQANH